ncbi:hypothetical protein [Candidatus Nitrosocosmicus sp. SS]|jgi:hypothetical protein|uniref:hypothetical protein n=1 Tax=Candidatus Nitrosocosmicus agrestis TaxID=2563600 RepID=UPI00122E3AC5|nr:hypothetical protein [Candidatus Nitrosocosmicus sp. SS]KAA2283534.1 hypothetical protein F1Z66_01230 [Candidatus Nitrosocosmicus sp. SS]KAF0869615.1 hypothetical protein E5N71_03760 [Candidatus Nitrosocosmicus sp. SS]
MFTATQNRSYCILDPCEGIVFPISDYVLRKDAGSCPVNPDTSSDDNFTLLYCYTGNSSTSWRNRK